MIQPQRQGNLAFVIPSSASITALGVTLFKEELVAITRITHPARGDLSISSNVFCILMFVTSEKGTSNPVLLNPHKKDPIMAMDENVNHL